MPEPQLAERIRAGDRDAFDAVFREHYAGLVRVAERMTRSRAVAEELAQDVMFELWRRRHGLALRESLRAYLFRAVRNRALNHLRHERVVDRAAPYLTPHGPPDPPAHTDLREAEIDAALRAGVDALPDRCREVFRLSRVDGLKNAEIAEVLGVSVKAVEKQMGRALRELRERMAPWLGEWG